jgi:probable F420-dependent oxidoreductase
MLSFGVTVLPDPPYQRMIELMKLAEQHGFEYAWTYDSHILWEESYATLPLAAAQTSKIKLGHFVTNPGIRDATITASWYATMQDISDGRMVMGIGRGDSARRYIGQQPVRVAEFETACRMIKPFMNGEEVHWNDTDLQLKWVRPELPRIPMWIAGYGPKALAVAGRVADGVIIQLADPEIIQWIMATARAAAEEAGRDPAELKCIVCAPSHISDDIADAREQTRWFPAMVSNHVKDLIERYGTDGSVVPQALTDYVQAREFYEQALYKQGWALFKLGQYDECRSRTTSNVWSRNGR